MENQAVSKERGNSRSGWLRVAGGWGAIISGVILLLGVIGLMFSILQSGVAKGWENNWLIKVFILHAGFNDISANLAGVNLQDILIQLFVGLICLGYSTKYKNASKVTLLAAFGLSIVGILLFLVTGITGRSTVMLVVLILSIVMSREKPYNKILVFGGIITSVLLFVGDLTVGIQMNLITILFTIGYLLMIIWFFVIGRKMLQIHSVD